MKSKDKKRRKSKSRSRSPQRKRKGRRSHDSSPHYSSYHSNSSSSSSSSRSRSKDSKSRRASSSSSRSSSSRSRSRRGSRSDRHSRHSSPQRGFGKTSFDKKREELEKEEERKKRRPRVNPFMLSGILLDQKKTNTKMDDEEVVKANKQFKEVDRSERQATLLSNYINKTDEMTNKEEYFFDYVDGAYVKVLKPYICDYRKCGQRFRFHQELNQHLEAHMRDDRVHNNNPNAKRKMPLNK